MRAPMYAGTFYPRTKEELELELDKLFNVDTKYFNGAKGIVVPHAGYLYSGKVAAKVYKAISKINKKKFVILGVDHYNYGVIATSQQDWLTPLGKVKTDINFINKITEEQAIIVDEIAMEKEHSIEIQLPFLQHIFNNFKFVPIQLPSISYNDIKYIAELLTNKDTFYIASSDFTHYGSDFGFVPEESIYNPPKYVEELDSKLIEVIKEFEPERFLNYIIENDLTVCGYIPITLLLEITKKLDAKKIEKIAYDTSFSISKDSSHIVGYCGLLIY
jgi:hypothetical protein